MPKVIARPSSADQAPSARACATRRRRRWNFASSSSGSRRCWPMRRRSDLLLRGVEFETPLVRTKGQALAQRIGLVPILRAGLGMVDPILNLIPTAEVWHLGLYRDEETARPVEYYSKLPHDQPGRCGPGRRSDAGDRRLGDGGPGGPGPLGRAAPEGALDHRLAARRRNGRTRSFPRPRFTSARSIPS